MTLYLSDLDGTLLNYAGKLKPRASKMLNCFIKKGVKFSYATARGFLSSRRLTEELELNIPVIIMNGVMIADSTTGERIVTNLLTDDSIKKMMDYLITNNETPLMYSFIDGKERVSYLKNNTKRLRTYLNDRKGDIRFRPCDNYDELFVGEIFYCCLINPGSAVDELNGVFTFDNGFSVNYQEDTYNEKEYWYEIFAAGVSKGNAAKQLMELTGADRLVVFGDNVNDISMFSAADECYAVANAHPALKETATGIIASNDELGVPMLIEKQVTDIFRYEPGENLLKPDSARFNEALERALKRERAGIGTLNEKLIHSTLKNYYGGEIDHEAKIGNFYADAVGENGIYEIQTGSWGKLVNKLEEYLNACHVTVVYPFEKRVRNIYINEITGELIKKTPPHYFKKMTKFFMELYRIKEFLTNPNLTICIAELEIEKTRAVEDEKCIKKRRQSVSKTPVAILSETYLENRGDYRIFLPEELPETFDKKTFGKLCKISEASVLLEILEYMSIVYKCGKKGNAILYTAVPREQRFL